MQAGTRSAVIVWLFAGSSAAALGRPGLDPRPADPGTLRVPEGFRVELVAAEPAVRSPVALAIDPRGRLWVADDADEGEVLVLEDRDHDGAFERRAVFARGLGAIQGVEIGFGGAWVGAEARLLFLPDRDGDLALDGAARTWRVDRSSAGSTLSSLVWGPDGWLHGCHGSSAYPAGDAAAREACVVRFQPSAQVLEVFAPAASGLSGIAFDACGRTFASDRAFPRPYQVVEGAAIERAGPLADVAHGAPPDRLALLAPSGTERATCGALVYLADAFPPEWRGRILASDGDRARVKAFELDSAGSGLVARAVMDFCVAEDAAFLDLELAPEGSVYVVAQHAPGPRLASSGDEERANGRIYRVSYGAHRPLRVGLPALESDELVRLLFHENAWFATRARILLQERGPDPEVHTLLRRVLLERRDEGELLRALWALHATDGLDEDLAIELLLTPHPAVRACLVGFLLERPPASPAALDRLALLALSDPSPIVRLALASALHRLPLEQRFGLARPLVGRGEDAEDPHIPHLLWSAIEPLLAGHPEQTALLARESQIEEVARFIQRRSGPEPALSAER